MTDTIINDLVEALKPFANMIAPTTYDDRSIVGIVTAGDVRRAQDALSRVLA